MIDFVIGCMAGNDAIVTGFMEDEAFSDIMVDMICSDLPATVHAGEPIAKEYRS
ncbi:hypothetical protein [Fundidesulfovibrio butyratiphilus]